MTHGAARFTKRYTEAEKDAILHAVLIDNQTVAKTITDAADGKLNVPAFTVNRQYAYQIVKDNREAYEARNPEALRQAIDNELTTLAAKALAQARTLAKAEMADPDLLRRTVQALKAAQSALAKPATPPKNTPQSQTAPMNTPTTPDVLAGLLDSTAKNTGQGAKTGSLSHTPT